MPTSLPPSPIPSTRFPDDFTALVISLFYEGAHLQQQTEDILEAMLRNRSRFPYLVASARDIPSISKNALYSSNFKY